MPDNIYRIPGGYQVRFERGEQKPSKTFKADEYFGGDRAAKRAGEMWRDAMASLLPAPAPPEENLQTEEAQRRSWEARTRTGVKRIGYTTPTLSDGTRVLHIQGQWKGGSVKRSTHNRDLEDALSEVCAAVALGIHPYEERHLREETAQLMFDAALPALQEIAAQIENDEPEPSS